MKFNCKMCGREIKKYPCHVETCRYDPKRDSRIQRAKKKKKPSDKRGARR